MKTHKLLTFVAAGALVLLAPLAVQADTTTTTTEAKVVVRDAAIESSIEAQYKADPTGGFGHVRVEADDHGIVKLEGHANTKDAVDRAISIAKKTEGVREVRSELTVKIDD
jgi:osmotically-inducible protein OsmY